jgi:hypothetical protein
VPHCGGLELVHAPFAPSCLGGNKTEMGPHTSPIGGIIEDPCTEDRPLAGLEVSP